MFGIIAKLVVYSFCLFKLMFLQQNVRSVCLFNPVTFQRVATRAELLKTNSGHGSCIIINLKNKCLPVLQIRLGTSTRMTYIVDQGNVKQKNFEKKTIENLLTKSLNIYQIISYKVDCCLFIHNHII